MFCTNFCLLSLFAVLYVYLELFSTCLSQLKLWVIFVNKNKKEPLFNHLIYLLCPSNVPLKCTTTHPKLHDFCLDADVWSLEQDTDAWRVVGSHIAWQSWHIIVEPGGNKCQWLITCITSMQTSQNRPTCGSRIDNIIWPGVCTQRNGPTSRILPPDLNNGWMTSVIGRSHHVTAWTTPRLVWV